MGWASLEGLSGDAFWDSKPPEVPLPAYLPRAALDFLSKTKREKSRNKVH